MISISNGVFLFSDAPAVKAAICCLIEGLDKSTVNFRSDHIYIINVITFDGGFEFSILNKKGDQVYNFRREVGSVIKASTVRQQFYFHNGVIMMPGEYSEGNNRKGKIGGFHTLSDACEYAFRSMGCGEKVSPQVYKHMDIEKYVLDVASSRNIFFEKEGDRWRILDCR